MCIAANVFYLDWELSFLDWLQTLHNQMLDQVMTAITSLGNGGIFWIILALALLVTKKYRPWGIAVAAALLCSVTFGNGIIKNVVQRARPCWINEAIQPYILVTVPKDFSFPSGHTMASFAAAVALLLCSRKAGVPALVLGAVIAFSRLYLYVHWPTDVLGGLILGILWGVMGYFISRRILDWRQKRKQPDGS